MKIADKLILILKSRKVLIVLAIAFYVLYFFPNQTFAASYSWYAVLTASPTSGTVNAQGYLPVSLSGGGVTDDGREDHKYNIDLTFSCNDSNADTIIRNPFWSASSSLGQTLSAPGYCQYSAPTGQTYYFAKLVAQSNDPSNPDSFARQRIVVNPMFGITPNPTPTPRPVAESCLGGTSVQTTSATESEKAIFGDKAVALYSVTSAQDKQFKLILGGREISHSGSGGVVSFTYGFQNLGTSNYGDETDGIIMLSKLAFGESMSSRIGLDPFPWGMTLDHFLTFDHRNQVTPPQGYWYATKEMTIADYSSDIREYMFNGGGDGFAHVQVCIDHAFDLNFDLVTPTPSPTPTATPSLNPTVTPTASPSPTPTPLPTQTPTLTPSPTPTVRPGSPTPTPTPVPTLSATLNANPSSGDAPLTTNLTGTRSETSSGTTNFTFWFNCNDPGTSVVDVTTKCGDPTQVSVGAKYDAQAVASKVVNHIYSVAGQYTAKVIVERGTASPAEARTTVTATTPQTLSAALSVNPNQGTAPLSNVSFSATASGTAIGTINYTFYCNRSDSGTDITTGYVRKFDGIPDNPKVITACSYSSAGTYTAKVIIERGSAVPAEARAQIVVSAAPSPTPSPSPLPSPNPSPSPLLSPIPSPKPSPILSPVVPQNCTISFESGGQAIKINGSLVADTICFNSRSKGASGYAVSILSSQSVLNQPLPGFNALASVIFGQ
jgi:hypothetical protein